MLLDIINTARWFHFQRLTTFTTPMTATDKYEDASTDEDVDWKKLKPKEEEELMS